MIDKGAVSGGKLGAFSVRRANQNRGKTSRAGWVKNVSIQAHSIAHGNVNVKEFVNGRGGSSHTQACGAQPQRRGGFHHRIFSATSAHTQVEAATTSATAMFLISPRTCE